MSEDQFSEEAYKQALIERGADPTQAEGIARKTAESRGIPPASNTTRRTRSAKSSRPAEPDLFADQEQTPPPTSSATDLTSVAPAAKKARKKDALIIETGALIADNVPSGDDMAFMHSLMCQVGLPRSKVDGTSFERKSGGVALLIEAGKLWDGEKFVQQPVPYGPIPRLMLAWINTFAMRNQDPIVPVGNSASEFLRLLGKSTSGGRNGGFTSFKQQALALSACRMTLGFNAAGKAHTYDGKPIKQFDTWLATSPEQPALWPGVIILSDDYFNTLKTHALPIDLRAYSALKKSALAMDVYTALADRLHRIEGRPLVLHWANWRNQFGQEYQGKDADKDFKKKFVVALKDALAVYPQAKVKKVSGGIMLMHSPPPIPYKSAG